MTDHQVFFSIGSNLGDKERNLREAVRQLGERVGRVTRQSSFYATEPWGFQSANRFLNAAVCCATSLTPREVLTVTQQIERDMGRTAKTSGAYQDRVIDIDILLYDDVTVDEPDLKIPHPLMDERDFVMIPLNEIRQ